MGCVLALAAATPIRNIADYPHVERWSIKQYQTATATGPTATLFTADWCGPCKEISPTFSELSIRYPQVRFGEVDYSKEPRQKEEIDAIGVSRIPEIRIATGANVDRSVGINDTHAEDYQDLSRRIERMLQNPQ